MSSLISTYYWTWQLYLASWNKDWKQQQKITSQLDTHFNKNVPLVSCLVWNVVVFCTLQIVTNYYAGFSTSFQWFCFGGQILPCLAGSLAYYAYKYGLHDVLSALNNPTALWYWCHNFASMQTIGLVGLTQIVVLYFGGIYLQEWFLPHGHEWNFRLQFTTEIYEESLRLAIQWYAALFAICLTTMPFSMKGYNLSMETAGRKPNLSFREMFMEIIYQSSQSGVAIFGITPTLVLLSNHFNFRVYAVHIALALLEVVLINYAVRYKFCVTHKLMHDIKPLYHLTHLEHHLCKGVYFTTPGVGMWESTTSGQSNFFFNPIGMVPIPYMLLHTVCMGFNLVIHTMWPASCLLQWHTLHHTVLADVYNLNIPSPYDKENSKSVAKLQTQLEQVSPFVKYEALSDVAGFGFVVIVGFILHYGFGVGFFTVDWTKHMTVQYL